MRRAAAGIAKTYSIRESKLKISLLDTMREREKRKYTYILFCLTVFRLFPRSPPAKLLQEVKKKKNAANDECVCVYG